MKLDRIAIQNKQARPVGTNGSKSQASVPSRSAPETAATGLQDRSSVSFPNNSFSAKVSKERVDKWLAQTAKAGAEQAIVVGGGPAGLAAAVALAKRGLDVTVMELRADEKGEKPLHARPHQISLRQDTLEQLKDLGASMR